jgi:hypothetical protein
MHILGGAYLAKILQPLLERSLRVKLWFSTQAEHGSRHLGVKWNPLVFMKIRVASFRAIMICTVAEIKRLKKVCDCTRSFFFFFNCQAGKFS